MINLKRIEINHLSISIEEIIFLIKFIGLRVPIQTTFEKL